MGATRRFFSFIRASGAFLGAALGILIAPDKEDTDDRPLWDGSDLFGEHNFRTGNMDSGSDPDGWYEEDL